MQRNQARTTHSSTTLIEARLTRGIRCDSTGMITSYFQKPSNWFMFCMDLWLYTRLQNFIKYIFMTLLGMKESPLIARVMEVIIQN